MESWAGLGYYARARNLHKLARLVTRAGGTRHTPGAPGANYAALPGVGAYTAGAVASFAHERRAALVDTNVARVLCRAYSRRTCKPKRARDLTRLWAIAESILPRTGKATWVHNQAVMELGALVCTARVKRCDACPVAVRAPTLANGEGRRRAKGEGLASGERRRAGQGAKREGPGNEQRAREGLRAPRQPLARCSALRPSHIAQPLALCPTLALHPSPFAATS